MFETIRSSEWHMPYEAWKSAAPAQQIWDYPNLEIDQPGYAINNGGVGAKWNIEGPYWGDLSEALVASAFALAAPAITNPLYAGLWAVAGIGLSDIGPKPDQGVANFDDCWGVEGSTYNGNSQAPGNDEATQDQYKMVPVLRLGETIGFWQGDAYGHNGYIGPARKATRKFDGRRRWVGAFQMVGAGGGNGQ